jgi:hypothetical protein
MSQKYSSMSLRDFLQATFYSVDPSLTLGGKLTEDEYLDCFCAKTSDGEQIKKEIFSALKDKQQVFLITGYKGCGKTTFIHYCLRDYKTTFVDFDRIYHTKDTVKSKLILDFYDIINRDFDSDKSITNSFILFMQNPSNLSFFDREVDAENLYATVVSIFKQILSATDIEKLTVHRSHLKATLNHMQTNQILTMLVVWEILRQKSLGQINKHAIVFDNLDAIHITQELDDLMVEFITFYHNASYIFNNIVIDGLPCNDTSIFYNFSFFFVMRETTKAKVSDHFYDRYHNDFFFRDISTTFPKYHIFEHRFNYYTSNRLLFESDISKDLENLKTILDDDKLANALDSMFNSDYRTLTEMLSSIKSTMLSEASKFLTRSKKSDNFAGRSIVYHEIFNCFYNERYMDALKSTEFSFVQNGNETAVNISRLLLNFLRSYITDYRPKEYLRDKNGVSLLDVFTTFDNICPLERVVTALWALFSLKDQKYWNHLLTFDNIDELSDEELSNKLSDYQCGKKDHFKYPKVRISCAGRIYIDLISTNFDYYWARSSQGSKNSIFLMTNKTNGVYDFIDALDCTYNEIKCTVMKISNFYNEVFVKQLHYTRDKYLASRFAYRRVDEDDFAVINHMFQGERIVHSCINYLDSFRRFLLSHTSNRKEKIEINNIMIDTLQKYIRLLKDHVLVYSDQTTLLIEHYELCIYKIKQTGSKISMPINRKTAIKLRRSDPATYNAWRSQND